MKKLIFTILTTITILGINAQGNNLQFNRALFEDLGTVTTSTGTITIQNSFTVPTNKIWKVLGMDARSLNLLYTSNYIGISKSGNKKFMIAPTTGTGNDKIIWLPEGSYDVKMKGQQSSNVIYYLTLTGVEFNIVP